MKPAHRLMTKTLAAKIPALYATEHEADPTVYAKYFTPDSSWTWYVTEYSPVAPDGAPRVCFGLVDGQDKELGYFSLAALEAVRGPLGLQVERDLHFKECKLSEVNK